MENDFKGDISIHRTRMVLHILELMSSQSIQLSFRIFGGRAVEKYPPYRSMARGTALAKIACDRWMALRSSWQWLFLLGLLTLSRTNEQLKLDET